MRPVHDMAFLNLRRARYPRFDVTIQIMPPPDWVLLLRLRDGKKAGIATAYAHKQHTLLSASWATFQGFIRCFPLVVTEEERRGEDSQRTSKANMNPATIPCTTAHRYGGTGRTMYQ
ncbi:hypothetical protein EYF80_023651 [Liparis tanakae]|uniref:Uncharacterized protein n=1 Tax=Liparis tanakae TaxID=230148 RepID=A0A4Z2HMG4_9TELE|nr:hypothetical protein EYF80_023651 [Liparis tanakae]